MPYIPHTPEDIAAMLTSINVPDIESLFDEIPQELRAETMQVIPDGMNEMHLLKHAQQLAANNQNATCFIGAGCYDHHIPAAVWDIASRGEFLTAYTPYQAEASQGTLQLLYEFQTMIAELTGMDVANASMYDGATALAEAVLMAIRLNRHANRQHHTHRILVTGTLHPFYRDTLETILRHQQIELLTLPFDAAQGITLIDALNDYNTSDIAALVIMQPNFFGCLEHVDALSDWANDHEVISIACVNPISLGLFKPPSQWGQHGVDIVCGEGQALGSPMASGGPYFGFFSTRKAHVRQMPGRLVGRTLDQAKKPGYTLTLQAREQHIRRAKATSNICTNQGLLVTAATIHMSLLGATGLNRVAQHCHHNTHELVHLLTQIPGVSLQFSAPYFHEAVLKFDRPVEPLLTALHQQGILGGYPIESHFSALSNTLLVCATEMRTQDELLHYQQTLKTVMGVSK